VADIPIEARGGREVSHVEGLGEDGRVMEVRITPDKSGALNLAFDVTPSRLVTGLITERGICAVNETGMRAIGLL
jgi:methylthioribose-1-phosphate isomerase